MRDLVVSSFVTLDGVMQRPAARRRIRREGSPGGWSVTAWDETMMETMGEAEGTPSDYVLGRKTYEIFAAHWPRRRPDGREADRVHEVRGVEHARGCRLGEYGRDRRRRRRKGPRTEGRDGPPLRVWGALISTRRSPRTTSSTSTRSGSFRSS